ncbi:MAG: dehydrogenase chain, partial [Pseudomonadota bacterium]
MTLEQLKLFTIAPEIALFVLLSAVMLADAFLKKRSEVLVHMGSLAGLVFIGLWQMFEALTISPAIGMNGLVVVDPMAALLKSGASFATAVTLVYARRTLADQSMAFGAYHLFALFSLLGGFVMISANHLLTVYLGVELLSLALYAAVALRRESAVSTEAAMKYFVLGALASGFLLYGMSMIYGATGALEITA